MHEPINPKGQTAIDQAAIDLQTQLDRDLLDHETTKNLCEKFLDEYHTEKLANEQKR